MEFWQQLTILLVTPALLVCSVAYILRRVIDRGIDRELSRYRHELETQRMKEHVRFSLIHQKRADVIGIVYGRLKRASRLLEKLVEPLQIADDIPLPEKKEEVRLTIIRTRDYFDEHRIYLDKSICLEIDDFLSGMLRVFVKFSVAQPGEKYTRDPSGQWEQSWKDLMEKLTPIMQELDQMFRRALEADVRPVP